MQALNKIAEFCPEALVQVSEDMTIDEKKLDSNTCEQIDRGFEQ